MTHQIPPKASRTRNAPYGSEKVLVVGEPAETRAFCREALSGCGYRVLEAANFQHADAILDELGGDVDLILACAASYGDHAAFPAAHSEGWALPFLILDVGNHATMPDIYAAEIALRVRLALEAARPSRSILIVTEDRLEREMIADLLKTAGYEVSEARNGKEAIRLLATNAPDILLTEIVMSEVDGLELLQEVRKHYPGTAAVVMSGTDRAERYLSTARLLGAKGALKEPLSVEELLRVLREVQNEIDGEVLV